MCYDWWKPAEKLGTFFQFTWYNGVEEKRRREYKKLPWLLPFSSKQCALAQRAITGTFGSVPLRLTDSHGNFQQVKKEQLPVLYFLQLVEISVPIEVKIAMFLYHWDVFSIVQACPEAKSAFSVCYRRWLRQVKVLSVYATTWPRRQVVNPHLKAQPPEVAEIMEAEEEDLEPSWSTAPEDEDMEPSCKRARMACL